MTDKVQKIREWVKSRLDENASKQSLPQFYGMMEEDARVLDFLDTLQEEPTTSVWHDKSEKPKMNSIIVMNNNQTTLSVEYVGQSLCGVERWAYIDNLLKL